MSNNFFIRFNYGDIISGRSDLTTYRSIPKIGVVIIRGSIKNFDTPYEDRSQSYLAGLTGGFSTRLGAAIRHAAEDLKTQLTHRRLILVLSDGEPSDIDVSDKNYLVEDARHAIHSLAQHGIDVFCVGLDSGGENYLTRIFGQRNFVLINKLESLPERLPMLYFRLTT